MTESEYEGWLSQLASDIELVLSIILEGRESLVFLAPMGAYNAIAIEVWQAVAQWDIQRADDGTMNAVRYGVPGSDPEHTQTLANLKNRITAATTGAAGASTKRIANTSGLTQYYRDIGAYGDITPDDGSTETFTPAQPPPSCGGAVPDTRNNLDLRADCRVLLAFKDALRGTAALNWDAGREVSGWDGVTVGGTPMRVTKLLLSNRSLNGGIPQQLGRLSELTHLDLSRNGLTGEISVELGSLSKLVELRLSGNSLTGCIPLVLKDVASNDLSSLGLPYCMPPAPEGLSAEAAGADSVPLSWSAVPNASKYRVEYRAGMDGEWSTASDSVTETNYTVEGLNSNTTYEFRVSAYGDGTVYQATWGLASAVLVASTPLPPPPAPTGMRLDEGVIYNRMQWDAADGVSHWRLERRREAEASGASRGTRSIPG